MTWTNKRKDPDRKQPFHRINSPWFKEPAERKGKVVTLSTGQQALVVGADGGGYRCGCRSIEDFPPGDFLDQMKLSFLQFIGLVTGLGDPREVMHTLPGWVPVLNSNPMAPSPPDDVDNPTQVEFEGTLIRSFQTWTDAPAAQWHEWFDWNFHVVPREDPKEGGYAYLRGLANSPPEVTDKGFTPLIDKRVMELEWDCGALGSGLPGPMFHGILVKPDGTTDPDDDRWFWPMRDHFIWGTGRWIYDCGHGNPPDTVPEGANKAGLMRTELHPVKAIASARWEAVKFEENQNFVPAIQFMFFASRRGGYKTWKAINDVDYEFIVDLPVLNLPQTIAWQIGHTPEFPFNTGALRTPHLLKKVRFMEIPPDKQTTGKPQVPGKVTPIVEPFREDDDPPNLPPKQVKVKVPCTQLPASADYYGFVLSLGWHDPDNTEARRVKDVSVSLDTFTVGKGIKDTFFFTGPSAEWQLRVGVNGRWMQTILYEGITEDTTKPIQVDAGKKSVTLHLADDDALSFNCHGVEYDRVGDFMRENSVDKRTLKKNGKTAQWEPDIVIKDSDKKVLQETISAVGSLLTSTLGIQNDPLGMIDPGQGPDADKPKNPLEMKTIKDQKDEIKAKPTTLAAFFTKEVGSLAELAENRSIVNYTLNYTLSVTLQKVGGS